MIGFRQLLNVFCIFSLSLTALSQDAYKIAPPPDWVDVQPIDFETPQPYEGTIPGTYFRLADVQSDLESETTYSHYAEEVLTGAGLQHLDEIEVHFDPKYQSVVLHCLKLHRGGEVIDILNPEYIRIHQTESELGIGIWNGTKSLIHFVPEVQVGDIIEQAYSVRGANPVFGGRYTESMSLEWDTPVLHTHFCVRAPIDRQLLHKTYKIGYEPKIEEQSDFRKYIWSLENTSAVVANDSVPSWFDQYGWTQLTEFKSWNEVAEWASKIYDFSADTIKPAEQERLDAIRDEYAELDNQALAIIRWISDDIRYLGLEEGAEAFAPRPPNKTLVNQFGDCKDKTVLLGRLLKEIGIESDPMYVHSEEGRRLPHLLPTPLAFDHVILRIKMPDGRIILADPTYNQLGGSIDELRFRHYHYGLVLNPETTELTRIENNTLDQDEYLVEHDLYLGNEDEPAQLTVKSTYKGTPANDLRVQFSTDQPEVIEKTSLDYYRDDFPTIELDSPITFEDDRDQNKLVIHENYTIPQVWKPDRNDPSYVGVHIYLNAVRNSIRRVINPHNRDTPFELLEMRRSELFRIHLPESHNWNFDPSKQTVSGPGVEYTRTIEFEDNLLTIRGDYEVSADHVSVKQLPGYYDAIEELLDLTYYSIWLEIEAPKAPPEDYSDEENVTGYPAWIWSGQPPNTGMIVALFVLALSGIGFVRRIAARKSPPLLPNSDIAEFRESRGFLGFIFFALILIPVFSLAIIPFQSWHHFVHPYSTYDNAIVFVLKAGVQAVVLAVKIFAAFFIPIGILIQLARWRQKGRVQAVFYFITYPLLLLFAMLINMLQHPHPDILFVSSAVELGVVSLIAVIAIPYLVGSSRLKAALT